MWSLTKNLGPLVAGALIALSLRRKPIALHWVVAFGCVFVLPWNRTFLVGLLAVWAAEVSIWKHLAGPRRDAVPGRLLIVFSGLVFGSAALGFALQDTLDSDSARKYFLYPVFYCAVWTWLISKTLWTARGGGDGAARLRPRPGHRGGLLWLAPMAAWASDPPL